MPDWARAVRERDNREAIVIALKKNVALLMLSATLIYLLMYSEISNVKSFLY